MCEETMNLFETRACQVLLKCNNDEEDILEDSDSNDDIDFVKAVKANERKRKREEMGESQYINCDFIMGSAACVERLWSEADAIFTKRRNGLSPITFEMILFLKKNHDLWDLSDVVEADRLRLQAKAESRAANRIREENDFNLLMGGLNINADDIF